MNSHRLTLKESERLKLATASRPEASSLISKSFVTKRKTPTGILRPSEPTRASPLMVVDSSPQSTWTPSWSRRRSAAKRRAILTSPRLKIQPLSAPVSFLLRERSTKATLKRSISNLNTSKNLLWLLTPRKSAI